MDGVDHRTGAGAVVFVVLIADPSGAAVDHVFALTAEEPVVARAALDVVGEFSAIDHVVAVAGKDRGAEAAAATSKDRVAARATEEVVVGGSPLQEVALKAAGHVVPLERAIHRVVAVAADKQREKRRAATGRVGRAPAAGHQPVADGVGEPHRAALHGNREVGGDVLGGVGCRRGGGGRFALGVDDVVAGAAVDEVEAEAALDQVGVDFELAAVVAARAGGGD